MFARTVGHSVGLEQVREQSLVDGGVPAQGLFVEDEQEVVELHEELVQHCEDAQNKEGSTGMEK